MALRARLGDRLRDARPLFALVACGLIDAFAFDNLTEYSELPGWLESDALWLVVTVGLGGAALVTWLRRERRALRLVIGLYAAYITLSLVSSIYALITSLGGRTGDAGDLLWDAGVCWGINILIFAVWYWFIDGGGPDERRAGTAARYDFAFPQQQDEMPGWQNWAPDFLDYLFLAYTTSTAFSPTDALPLSRRGKMLMLAKSLLALLIVVTLVARAINVLT